MESPLSSVYGSRSTRVSDIDCHAVIDSPAFAFDNSAGHGGPTLLIKVGV
jgi:hypothetical protein